LFGQAVGRGLGCPPMSTRFFARIPPEAARWPACVIETSTIGCARISVAAAGSAARRPTQGAAPRASAGALMELGGAFARPSSTA